MNEFVGLGMLARDPEIRYTQQGKAVASFTLAINRYSKDKSKNEADFIPVIVWGNQAEFMGNNVKKGAEVLVKGSIKTRSYDNKDGNKVYVTEIAAHIVKVFGNKKKSEPEPNSQESFGTDVSLDDEVPF